MRKKKIHPSVAYTKTYLNIKNRHHLMVKGWKKISQANGPKKQDAVLIFISNKTAFKSKLITRENTTYSSKEKSTKRVLQLLISRHQTKG